MKNNKKLKSFVIDVPELHYTRYTLTAKDLTEAHDIINTTALEGTTRYERTFDPDEKEWITVAERKYDKKLKEYIIIKHQE